MRKTYLAFVFFLITMINVFGQKQADISGVYSYKGGHYFIKPNGEYALLGYATFITGKWKIIDNNKVEFTPNFDKNKFVLYGRHTTHKKTTTKIMFNAFYDDETFLQFGDIGSNIPEMKRVFKAGHRIISFPYVYEVEGIKEVINLAYYPMDKNHEKLKKAEIYSIKNPEKYNDFVGYFNMPSYKYEPFYWLIKNGKLYQDLDYSAKKVELKEAYEQMGKDMIDMIESTFVITTDEIFVTPKYNYVDKAKEDITKKYKYVSDINGWVDPLNYKRGDESNPELDYNNLDIVYEFKKLNKFSVKTSAIKIIQSPIFKSEVD